MRYSVKGNEIPCFLFHSIICKIRKKTKPSLFEKVELSAQLVHNMLFHSPINDVYIVDAGDGKGYLSSRLALEYGYKVLGIDSNNTNSINALERNRKLQVEEI